MILAVLKELEDLRVETYSYNCRLKRTELWRKWWTPAFWVGIYIYIHIQPESIEAGFWLLIGCVSCLERGAGSEVTLLICEQVVLTRRPVLLSSTIVGGTGTVTAISRKFACPLCTHTHTHTQTHTLKHTQLFLQPRSHTLSHFLYKFFLFFFIHPFCHFLQFPCDLVCLSPPYSLSLFLLILGSAGPSLWAPCV